MVDIDYVMELMDWNNSIEDQKKGVELARNIKCLNAFLQPGAPYGKSVWENCAKVLAERTNKELVSCLHGMLDTGYELAGSFLHIRTPEEFEKNSRISMLV